MQLTQLTMVLQLWTVIMKSPDSDLVLVVRSTLNWSFTQEYSTALDIPIPYCHWTRTWTRGMQCLSSCL